MSKQALNELANEIQSEKGGSHLAMQATQLVMGNGSPTADILFVGEAPGKKEDIEGVPFIGASGKFLNEMLSAANLVRSDVYVTNIVKYRPPNNRDPSPDEIREFWPYLMRQIKIINPKVVITLGRHSGACFIPNLIISRDHGQAQKIRFNEIDLLVIPLYHPAAALYNGSMRQILIDDFLAAVQLAHLQK